MSDNITYKGVPIEDLTRDQLLEALREALQQFRRERDQHKTTIEMWDLASKYRSSAH
jgi:hypothetical protein